ncbi:histidine kinase [Acetobacter aceti 1023]|nr:histidine kinase [Acetobacter aceti 1023]
MFQDIIHAINKATSALTQGDLSYRISLGSSKSELDDVAAAINTMLERITHLMEKTRQASNTIAHDLRRPITYACFQLEDAALHAHSEEDLRTAIAQAIKHLDHVTSICGALLRIADIEAGMCRAAFTWFDLAPALQDVLELYTVVAENRGLIIKATFPEHLPFYGDRTMIQQALANVLDNAIKFSPCAGVITCAAHFLPPLPTSENNGSIELKITDQGIGMTPEEMAHATERFFRAEQARHAPGFGLGLSIVQAIVQLHGGQLHLADNTPGLIVRIDIPLPFPGKSATL